MNTDVETLIACSACAKAKAKCDKRLPTCSRCLFKRLQCEPRQPRRYPEAYQFLQSPSPSQSQSQSQSQPMSLPASNTPSPQNHSDLMVDDAFHQLFPADRNGSFAHAPTFDGLQWHQPTGTDLSACAVDAPIEAAHPAMRHFDHSFLDGAALFSASDTAMDYDFTSAPLGISTSQSQSQPADTMLTPGQPSSLQTVPTDTSHIETSQDSSSSAGADEDWPCFSCNPRSRQPINPRIGGEYLMHLEKTLNEQYTWKTADFSITSPGLGGKVYIEPVQESLRDRLMVISQGFFSHARDVHRARIGETVLAKPRRPSNASFTGFFILPPAVVLEAFLRTYGSQVEPYMPFFPGASISPTKLIASNDEKASILLLLLMIALGAMGSAVREARYFAYGLIETCRICIFDVMEKNVQLSAHPVMLRCALLYLHASSWSGNKWHMDLSAAQLRMFTSMLKHSRILDSRASSPTNIDSTSQADVTWKIWQAEESLNRLAYSWVLLDQEMNLFHDRQPDLDINELHAPIPESDNLWNAASVEDWRRAYIDRRPTVPQTASSARRSLATLFRQFMSNELSENSPTPSSLELRLLLHPLQALTYQLNKSLMYFFNASSQRLLQRLLTQLEEVQYLLKQWYALANRSIAGRVSFSMYHCCNMVMYHLTCLNTITYFPDIERLARGETPLEEFRESPWGGKRCIEDAAQIWCHSGQVFRYFRQLPAGSRPYWWSGSIYRIALCTWATGLSSRTDSPIGAYRETGLEQVVVDAHPLDHPSIVRYLRHQDGAPVLSYADGTPVPMDSPLEVIKHCVGVLKENGQGTQLDERIQARLTLLVERWSLRQM